jgi:hypothetical protein
MTPSPQTPGSDPVRLRDAALHRISVTRRWVIAGAAALTAGLAALVSALLPGKSLGAKPVTPAASAHATKAATNVTPALPTPASAAQLGVGSGEESDPSIPPPSAAPQPAPAPAAPAPSASPSAGAGAAVSGGS